MSGGKRERTSLVFDFACSDDELTAQWDHALSLNRSRIQTELTYMSAGLEDAGSATGDKSLAVRLITNIVGIRAGEPGFTLVRVAPHPGEIDWAAGAIEIPAGTVKVSWRRSDNHFTLDVSIPLGVHLQPILPSRLTDRLFIDDEPVDEDSIIRRDDAEAELCVMPGVGYRFEVVSGNE